MRKHSAGGCRGALPTCRLGRGGAVAIATASKYAKYSARYSGRKCGDQIARMSDRGGELHVNRRASRSQVKIALRLQLDDPHHAAALGGNKARQQILQRDILRLHGVAAGGELKTGFGELTDAF